MISLGAGLDTAFDISIPTRAAVAAVRWVHVPDDRPGGAQRLLHRHLPLPLHQDFAGEFPASVPLISIYTRGDGVVWWEACTVPYARNVEVTGATSASRSTARPTASSATRSFRSSSARDYGSVPAGWERRTP